MSYSFQPLRFTLALIGLTIVVAIANGTLHAVAGFGLPQSVAGILAIVGAVGIEGNLCGRRNRAAPSEALLRRTALSMALWGTATFLMLGLFGVVVAGGDLAALPPGLWMSILATVAIYAATLLIVGYLLFGAVARRVAAERQ
ncbi:ABZJ_00895 family protein [Mangrovicoccus sp. HB161399]|uniref:ABZJ_00895 family protein n=1 Tax=Mangrovicoccus sp. HB161399 TaxID=2720392 RepID=UPI0015542F94|nr:ABZJ_00895 family protein [Mangrovicoccus sp. HB161399]